MQEKKVSSLFVVQHFIKNSKLPGWLSKFYIYVNAEVCLYCLASCTVFKFQNCQVRILVLTSAICIYWTSALFRLLGHLHFSDP